MGKYILLSNLTDEGRRTIKMRPDRINEVNKELEEMGAKVEAQYAALGPYDFVNIVEAPDNETITKDRNRTRFKGNCPYRNPGRNPDRRV